MWGITTKSVNGVGLPRSSKTRSCSVVVKKGAGPSLLLLHQTSDMKFAKDFFLFQKIHNEFLYTVSGEMLAVEKIYSVLDNGGLAV